MLRKYCNKCAAEAPMHRTKGCDGLHMACPPGVLQDIRQYKGLDVNDTSHDQEIDDMSMREALEAYLSWNGIHGYTNAILSIVRAYRSADNED